LKYRVVDAVVFKKIRQRFGGRLTGALTASAMMNEKVARFFADVGLPVYDCYGLSETSPAVTVSCPSACKPGSVGRPIDKVTVVIDRRSAGDDEGEIVVHGPNVMQGYHNKPQATRTIMTQDGGLRTGDQGRIDEEGYLYITGRIKEQYKLENGKYVFPAGIEEEIQLSPWIDNALVFGEGRVCNVCLVVPDFGALKSWAQSRGYDSTPAALIENPAAGEMICQVIQHQLKGKFGGYEIPKSVVLIKEGFSVENGMLTQTLKLKRRKVIEHYFQQIERAYAAV
jgi:long-chain acyl-CoA synthetase